jgi:hypothetical protein
VESSEHTILLTTGGAFRRPVQFQLCGRGRFVRHHSAMKELFHGWRRKAGVATLVLACVLMGVWARSYLIEDEFWYAENHGSGPHFALIVVSHTGISWWSWQSPTLPNPAPRSDWRSFPVNSKSKFDVFNSHQRSIPYLRTRVEMREWHSPLWPFAILAILPLATLSAYLIVWRPRKRSSPY